MKLLIIDDHPMTCAGLRSLLLGHWPTAQVDMLHRFSPEVVNADWTHLFLDIHLPGQPFEEVLNALKPRLGQVVLVSAYPQPAAVQWAQHMGVCGLLPKNIDIEHILQGFHRILAGERVFIGHDGQPLPWASPAPSLTPRQQDTFQAMLAGLSNKQIARKLGISEHTVKEHVTAILAAHGVKNRLELLLQRPATPTPPR